MPRSLGDEIQLMGEKHRSAHEHDSFICQFCHGDLLNLTVAQRQDHYEAHLLSFETPRHGHGTNSPRHPSGKRPSADKSRKKWKIHLPCDETDAFWYPAQAEPPPPSFTPGLVPILKKALSKSHYQGFTRRAALCHSSTVHIRREVWDHGWGCGYRNYLMASSALLCQKARPEYHHLIMNHSRRPGVRDLQRLIQEAWDAGFDQEGQDQLKALVGTSKWIGTSDLYVAFTFCGIPCELVEFNLGDSEDRVPDALISWVVNYFTPQARHKPSDINEALCRASPVMLTEHMPIILQHHGHSRTIVGYEIARDGGVNLLIFDPSFRPDNRLRTVAIDSFYQLEGLRRSQESSAHHHSAMGQRSDSHANEFIDVDADESIGFTNGTKSFSKLLPSDEKLSQRLLGACRLSPRRLSREKRYQILYFPMTAPLTYEDKAARKVVTGTMAS